MILELFAGAAYQPAFKPRVFYIPAAGFSIAATALVGRSRVQVIPTWLSDIFGS